MKITLAILLAVLSFTNPAKAQQYLGRLSQNRYNADSVSNPYGQYSNKYSPDSINNPYGAGNKYSADSPNNPYGKGWKIIGDDR